MTDEIFWLIFLVALLDLFFFVVVSVITDDFWFNPKDNYEKWYKLNWFGVWFITILYWIVFLPITTMVLISWLFTVGRK